MAPEKNREASPQGWRLYVYSLGFVVLVLAGRALLPNIPAILGLIASVALMVLLLQLYVVVFTRRGRW